MFYLLLNHEINYYYNDIFKKKFLKFVYFSIFLKFKRVKNLQI